MAYPVSGKVFSRNISGQDTREPRSANHMSDQRRPGGQAHGAAGVAYAEKQT